jgi:hypothetical protein
MQNDSDFITLAQAFSQLRAYRYGADRPKFSTAKATIRHLHRYVRSSVKIPGAKIVKGRIPVEGQIPLRGELDGVVVGIPFTDCLYGTLRISRGTLEIYDEESDSFRIYKTVYGRKASVEKIVSTPKAIYPKPAMDWNDISYALGIIQDVGASIGVADIGDTQLSVILTEAILSKRVSSQYPPNPHRWLETVPVPLQFWENGTIDKCRLLIRAAGRWKEVEKVEINYADLLHNPDYLATLIRKPAAGHDVVVDTEAAPVELPAPATEHTVDPVRIGRKPGEKTEKEKQCDEAEKIMNSGIIPRRRGYLTNVARQVKINLNSTYQPNSIEGHIRQTVHDWVKKHPAAKENNPI